MSGKIIARVREREARKEQKAMFEAGSTYWAAMLPVSKPPPFWLAVGLPAALALAITIGGFAYIFWSKP